MKIRANGIPSQMPAKSSTDPTIPPTIRMAMMAAAICMAPEVYFARVRGHGSVYAEVMDSIRPILRAAAIAGLSVGLLLLLLNPPSLSGAGGLLALVAGIVGF